MSLYLKRLTPLDGYDVYTMTQAMPKEENGFQNSASGLSFEEFPAWLQKQHVISMGIDLPKGFIAQTVYWLYDGDQPVSSCKLRLTRC